MQLGKPTGRDVVTWIGYTHSYSPARYFACSRRSYWSELTFEAGYMSRNRTARSLPTIQEARGRCSASRVTHADAELMLDIRVFYAALRLRSRRGDMDAYQINRGGLREKVLEGSRVRGSRKLWAATNPGRPRPTSSPCH